MPLDIVLQLDYNVVHGMDLSINLQNAQDMD